MAGLPLLKLAGLLVKTIAKPLASKIKAEAGKHPKFSTFCSSIGETAHQLTSRMNVFASGYRFIGAKPLPQEEALKQGIDVISETFLMFVAGGIMVVEYTRSELKNAKKAEQAAIKEANDKAELDRRFSSLESEMQELRSLMQTMEVCDYP